MPYLPEKLDEICSSLMIDPSARKITAFIACRKNPDTKIYILSITHIRETTQGFIHLFPHSHIKTPRIECIQMSPASSDPSCRKERSHRVIDRFLYSGKRRMRPVGTTKGIHLITHQGLVYLFQIAGRNDTIRIQDNHDLSFRITYPLIASQARA